MVLPSSSCVFVRLSFPLSAVSEPSSDGVVVIEFSDSCESVVMIKSAENIVNCKHVSIDLFSFRRNKILNEKKHCNEWCLQNEQEGIPVGYVSPACQPYPVVSWVHVSGESVSTHPQLPYEKND